METKDLAPLSRVVPAVTRDTIQQQILMQRYRQAVVRRRQPEQLCFDG
jgi:hypothetical protein